MRRQLAVFFLLFTPLAFAQEIDDKKEFKKVIREVKIPDQISIQELSNRMAEKSSDIIKFLLI